MNRQVAKGAKDFGKWLGFQSRKAKRRKVGISSNSIVVDADKME